MAVKKPSQRKKTQEKAPRTPPVSIMTNLKKIALGFVILICIVVSAGFMTRYLVIGHLPEGPVQTREGHEQTPEKTRHIPYNKRSAFSKPRHQAPVFEIYSKPKVPPPDPVVKPLPPKTEILPKVALIIDDIGYDVPVSNQLLALDAVLTFAIRPHSPHLNEIARRAHRKGIEIMLHLPMEPMEYPQVDPGPGALFANMSPDQLVKQLTRDLERVPYVIGVNNHMGSKITTISTQMYQVFSILKKRDLFFIDSRTTTATLCRPSARLLQIRFGQRDVFLDHLQTENAIRKQLRRLVRIAEKNGQAIGIGHPHSLTCEVLRRELPALTQRVRLVPASQVVHKPG